MFAFFYNIFYVPIAIAFEYNLSGGYYVLDGVVVFIYIIDIFVECYTAKLSKIGTIIVDQ